MPKLSGEITVVDKPITYTIKQAAEMLHTSTDGIYTLVKAGKIRVLKPRGTTLIFRDTLIEFVKSCEGWNLSDPKNPVKIDYGDI